MVGEVLSVKFHTDWNLLILIDKFLVIKFVKHWTQHLGKNTTNDYWLTMQLLLMDRLCPHDDGNLGGLNCRNQSLSDHVWWISCHEFVRKEMVWVYLWQKKTFNFDCFTCTIGSGQLRGKCSIEINFFYYQKTIEISHLVCECGRGPISVYCLLNFFKYYFFNNLGCKFFWC